MLRREGIYTPENGWGIWFARILLATTVMGALLAWGVGDLDTWLKADAGARALQLTVLVVGGVFVYLAALLLLGARPRELLLRRPGVGD